MLSPIGMETECNVKFCYKYRWCDHLRVSDLALKLVWRSQIKLWYKIIIGIKTQALIKNQVVTVTRFWDEDMCSRQTLMSQDLIGWSQIIISEFKIQDHQVWNSGGVSEDKFNSDK